MGGKSSISVHPRMIPSRPLATKVVAFGVAQSPTPIRRQRGRVALRLPDKVEGGVEGDHTLGYDIEVATKSRRFMFEVKGTAEDGTEFELTESEVNAARRNRRRDAYRIIFLSGMCWTPREPCPCLSQTPSLNAEPTRTVHRVLRRRRDGVGVEQAQELSAQARRMSLYGNLIAPRRRDARSSPDPRRACRAV
jgi:hypothetical protein